MSRACGDHHNSMRFVENPSDTQAIKYFSLNSASHLTIPENVAKYHSDFSPQTHRRTLDFWWMTCAKMNTRLEATSKALAFQLTSTHFTRRATMDGDNCDPLAVFSFNRNFANVVSVWDKHTMIMGDYWTSMCCWRLFQGLFNPGIFCFHLLLLNFIGGKLTLPSFHVSTKTFAPNRFWSSSGSPMGTRKHTFFFWGFMSLGPCLLWSCFVAVTSCLPKSKPGPPSYRHRDLFVCLPLFSFFFLTLSPRP